MKSSIFIFMLSSIMLLSSCGNLNVEDINEVINEDNALLSHAELIKDENRHLIGTKVIDESPPTIMESTPKIIENPQKASDDDANKLYIPENSIVKKMTNDTILPPINISNIDDDANKLYIPENSIVKKMANDTILPPINISNIEVIKGTSPEVIMPNGSAVLFTQEDLKGWPCKVGDTLIYEFEKYQSEVSSVQTMIIGYVLNGVLYPGEEVKNLQGTYQLEIEEKGDYYIYIISATSDYLALKEGTINIISSE